MPYSGLDPKSGCTLLAPLALMYAMMASELGSTGSAETSRFHSLSAGNTGQPAMVGPEPGAPPPLPPVLPVPPLPPVPAPPAPPVFALLLLEFEPQAARARPKVTTAMPSPFMSEAYQPR